MISKAINKNYLCLVLLTVIGVVMAGGAVAQTLQDRVPYDRELIARKASTNDDVGIAFLKTASNFPDFGKIVEKSEAYIKLDPLAQSDFKAKMVESLQGKYLSFQPGKSDLIIRLKVDILFGRDPDGKGKISFRTFKTDPIYFPFFFADYPIALIINDFEMFREIHLDKLEAELVYNRLSLDGFATMLLQVHPIAADDKTPIDLDGIPQYPLLAEIGYIGLLNNSAEQIWAWENTKYDSSRLSGGDSRAIIDMVPEK
jgi:hypothetical protein